MTVPVARSLAVVIVLVSAGAALTAVALAAQSPEVSAPVVYVAEVDSIIHPVSAEYMIETLAEADRAEAPRSWCSRFERPAASWIPRATSSRA